MIIGATEEWAQSKSKRKQHLRSVMTIERSSKRAKEDESWQIKFSPLDTNIVQDSGNDPIAISTIINTFLVERILIDDGSAVEVLMWKVFKEMGLEESQLKPSGQFMVLPTNQSDQRESSPYPLILAKANTPLW